VFASHVSTTAQANPLTLHHQTNVYHPRHHSIHEQSYFSRIITLPIMPTAVPARVPNNLGEPQTPPRRRHRPSDIGNTAGLNIAASRSGVSSWDDDVPTLSSSVDSDFGGGAPITPQDVRGSLRVRGKTRFSERLYETDDDSDGGMAVGFNMEIDNIMMVDDAFHLEDLEEGEMLDSERTPRLGQGRFTNVVEQDEDEQEGHEEGQECEFEFEAEADNRRIAMREVEEVQEEEAVEEMEMEDGEQEESEDEDEDISDTDSVALERLMNSLSPHTRGLLSSSYLENQPVTLLFGDSFPPGSPEANMIHSTTIDPIEISLSSPSYPSSDSDFDEDGLMSLTGPIDWTVPDPDHSLGFFPANEEVFGNASVSQDVDIYNEPFGAFCTRLWELNYGILRHRRESCPGITAGPKQVQDWSDSRKEISANGSEDEDGETWNGDPQGIPWEDFGLNLTAVRRWRHRSYRSYRNCHETDPSKRAIPVPPSTSPLYTFQRQFPCEPRISHFQLRHLLAVSDRNNIFYSTARTVEAYHPITQQASTILELSDFLRPSTLAANTDVLIAGGYHGTFALLPLAASDSTMAHYGTITNHENAITNHISLPTSSYRNNEAAISSNDNSMRLLDLPTLRITDTHSYDFPLNSSALSTDGRLRLLVGDSCNTLIVSAQSGRVEKELVGHSDYGFCAAWGNDGYSFVTGNQDMTVRLWDARMWRETRKWRARMSAARSICWADSSKLVVAEGADYVHIIDTKSGTFSEEEYCGGFSRSSDMDFKEVIDQNEGMSADGYVWNEGGTWVSGGGAGPRKGEKGQTLEFFGEIGGIGVTEGELVVANCDKLVGGIMTYTRSVWNEKEGERRRCIGAAADLFV
jgi:WD40 repeat protein